MAEHLTEEEQIEAIKQWWKQNGNGIIVGTALAVAGYFGYQTWQNTTQANAEAASAVFQQLLDVTANTQVLTPEQASSSLFLVDQLKNDHASSGYAHDAALLAAKIAVDQDNLAAAAEQLEWVLAQKPSEAVQNITTLRLARVQLALGESEKALSTADSVSAVAFTATKEEVRGDVLAKLGRVEEARTAYNSALAAQAASQNTALLEMKLYDLASVTSDVQAAAE